MFTPFLIELDRSRNGIQKILIAKRLGEEIDSAGLHGPYRHGYISMSRNEHDRNANIRLRQLGLEVETAQSRQPDVEYKAAWNIRTLALQEFLRRCEYLDPQLYRLKEPRKRLTHRGVVVHDEDDRLVRAPDGLRGRTALGHPAAPHCGSAEAKINAGRLTQPPDPLQKPPVSTWIQGQKPV